MSNYLDYDHSNETFTEAIGFPSLEEAQKISNRAYEIEKEVSENGNGTLSEAMEKYEKEFSKRELVFIIGVLKNDLHKRQDNPFGDLEEFLESISSKQD